MFEHGEIVDVVDAPGYEDFRGVVVMISIKFRKAIIEDEQGEWHTLPFATLRTVI